LQASFIKTKLAIKDYIPSKVTLPLDKSNLTPNATEFIY